MSEPYEDIPQEGEHLTDDSEHVSGFNVRAQKPPAADEYDGEPAGSVYRLSHSEGKGHYRVQTWTPGEVGQLEEGYAERGRYTSAEDLHQAVGELGEKPQYVVFENTERGDVYFDPQNSLSDNWTAGGTFDQMTLFTDENEAAAFAERRRKELEG